MFAGKKRRRLAGLISLAGILAGLCLLILSPTADMEVFYGGLTCDQFALFFKIIFLITGCLTIAFSFRFFEFERFEPGEVYYLLVLAIIGMMFTVSAVDIISFYASFEIFSIISCILAVKFKKEKQSSKAAVKYFILVILSSVIMILGIALVFVLTGETNFAAITGQMTTADRNIALAGMLLFFTGLFFRMTLMPFHIWTPDICEAAPAPLMIFISIAPTTAAFAVTIRLILTVFSRFEPEWSLIFSTIAAFTMFWGNIAAIKQNNLKRMMVCSSIAHAGYVSIALAAFGHLGNMSVLFYLFIYMFMNTASFGIILLIQKGDKYGENIEDLRGLARRSPLMAGGIIVLLLSLTGIPPTAGFIGKYYIFAAAVEKGMYHLAIAGILNSVISLFYYFRIGRAMFMEDSSGDITLDQSIYVKTALAFSIIAILIIGIFPSALTQIASNCSLK